MGKTVQESLQGSPYEEYGLAYVTEKNVNIGAEIAYLLDQERKTPYKIVKEVVNEDGEKVTKRVANPDSLENKLASVYEPVVELSKPQKTMGKWQYHKGGLTRIGVKFDTAEDRASFDKQADPVFREIREEYEKLVEKNADNPDFLAFKDMLDFNMMTFYPEKGDFTQAMADSPYLALLHSQVGGMPNFRKYSLKELREALEGPADPVTGEETKPLNLLNAYYRGISGLFELEYEKQKLQKTGYTQAQEKEYLGKLKDGMQSMVDAYDKMYAFEEKHHLEYKQGEYLNNNLDHLTGISPGENRSPRKSIGQLRGQIKAIENGWGMDELAILGTLGELKEVVETQIRKADYFFDQDKGRPERQKKIIESKKQNEALLEALKELDKTVMDRKVTNGAEKKEVLDTISKFVREGVKKYPLTELDTIFNVQNAAFLKESEAKVNDQIYRIYQREGIPAEFGVLSERMQYVIDIYGSNPVHHEVWNKEVIKKELFEERLKPYDASKLPFTETELVAIGMAYTSLNTPENLSIRKACEVNKMGTDRDLLEQNTFWTADMFMRETGPRENLASVSNIVANGRMGAKRVAESYAQGDRKPLAEVIQNALRVSLQNGEMDATLGSYSALYEYASLKSFLGMLERDEGLKKEFDAVNASVSAGDRVDLDRVQERLRLQKIAAEKFVAESELKGKTPMTEKRRNELYDAAIKGKIVNDVIMHERQKSDKSAKALKREVEFDLSQKKFLAEVAAGRANMTEYTSRALAFTQKKDIRNDAVRFLVSEEGERALGEFAEKMKQKYEKLKTGFNAVDPQKDAYEVEILKFTAEIYNNINLGKLNAGQKLSEQELKEITADYIRNEMISTRARVFLDGGERNRFAEAQGGKEVGEERKQDVIRYDDKLKEFIDQMNFLDMKQEDLAQLLQSGTLKDAADRLLDAAEFESVQASLQNVVDQKAAGKNVREIAPSLGDAIADLTAGKKRAWFGKEDYNTVLADLEEMNRTYQEKEAQFVKDGSDAFGPGFRKKQEDLLQRMQAYKTRKEQEFANNEQIGKTDNATSRARYDAMDKAIQSLKERMKFDEKYDRLLSASIEHEEYMKIARERTVERKNEWNVERKTEDPTVNTETHHDPSVGNKTAKDDFAKMDKKFESFKYLGTSFEGNSIDATGGGAYGLTNFEYMAAQMIATSSIKEAVKNGKVAPGRAMNQIGIETGKICKEEDFRAWIQNISNEDKEALSKKDADGVRKDFADALSKKLYDSDAEKTKDNTADKKKETVKTEAKKEAKKETKIKTPQKTQPEPTREVG
ncbi:MAG: hypothetical protein IJ147_01425 [Lachnospiraceae bacterium]|nr:hypothetical protein [Lachnospiraceae bacterium]